MAPTATSEKTKEASRGRSASTSGDRQRPRKPSSKKGSGKPAKLPSSTVSKSLLLPFITLWLIAVIALSGLVYWGIKSKPPSAATQNKKARSQLSQPLKPSPDSAVTTAESRKPPPHERTGQPDSPVARQANRIPPSRKASSQEIKEYDIPADQSKGKPSVSDQANPHPPAEAANQSDDHRTVTRPKSLPLMKHIPSVGASSAESPGASNPSEIRIDVTPLDASRAKPSEPARAPESPLTTPDPPPKSSESVHANHPPPTANDTPAESHMRSGPREVSASAQKESSQTSHGSMPALMSLANVSGNAPPPSPPSPLTATPVARVAIVIDDFGPDMEMAKKFLNLPLAITFSILPYQRHSQDIAELAHSQHHEVLLHMPMEPQGYPKANPGKGALLVSMSADTMQRAIQAALNASPYISGMNNHMGSRFTENPAFMKIVLSELNPRKLYFLDSCTSPKSVGSSTARELHIPSRQRDIFLDHKPSQDVTQSQIEQLIRKAKIQGTAIAIGHPHESTLRALKQHSNRFRQEKIAVVPAREIVGEWVNR